MFSFSITGRFVFFLFFFVTVLISSQAEAGARFPVYSIISPNILFWEKVYSKYTGSQGILHDKNDLNIIYTIIDLVPRNAPGAAKINEQLIRLVRLRYQNMLNKFADGKKPGTKEERRIFALFKGKTRAYTFREAAENLRLQHGLKDTFRKGVIRSGAYMPLIKKIMRARGLPQELAYLPHVESSFNLNAHSKAAAVGLWQFTKYTGREYMTVNELVDERFDVYLSSVAAANFLKENYRQLGSWPLALTAYNYGRAGMVRAQKKWGTFPRIIAHHETGIFKFASKNFYAEFVAALRVAKRLENDRSLIKERPWINVTFRLRGYAAVKKLCDYFKISRANFERLNPALRDPVLEGRKYIPKGTLIRLPATKRIRQRIQSMPSRLFHARQIRDKEYKIKEGDTLIAIARKFKLSVQELMQANGLSGKAIIRCGRTLKIPRPAKYIGGRQRKQSRMITLQVHTEDRKSTPPPEKKGVIPEPPAPSEHNDSIPTLRRQAKEAP
ncbi:MAG: transglycosylase SLT domain-containing protein [Candidatus Electrothrix sp. YB6]